MNERETINALSFGTDILVDYFIWLSIVEFPFLGLPVVREMYSYIVRKVMTRFKNEGELHISFAFIDKDVSIKKEEYKIAITQLKEVINSAATEEQKNDALKEAKNRIRNLIRFPIK